MFMIDVCSVVDCTMSPISARAPVLNTPMATPEILSSATKYANEFPTANR